MKKTLTWCSAAFILSLLLCCALLLGAAFLPQGPIVRHVAQDMEELRAEGSYSLLADRMSNSLLPMSSETLILIESVAMNREDLQAVFTNPYEAKQEGESYVDTLDTLLAGEEGEVYVNYVHYWMGFRAIFRCLLTVFGYYEIRRLIALAFFSLAIFTASSISRNLGPKLALAFAFSLVLVKPQVISSCYQYAICFFIAFAAMLLMPRLYRSRIPRTVIFFELGLFTMFLDFYTTPLITFGFPALYLYMLAEKQGEHLGWKKLLGYLAAWASGYLLMWLSKLTLTTLLTEVNGFESAIQAVSNWLVFDQRLSLAPPTDLLKNLAGVAYGFYQYPKWLALFGLFAAAFGLYYAVLLKKGRASGAVLRRNLVLLLVAVLPILWFAITSKAAYVHSAYQYRTLALLFFALGSWLAMAVREKLS